MLCFSSLGIDFWAAWVEMLRTNVFLVSVEWNENRNKIFKTVFKVNHYENRNPLNLLLYSIDPMT